MYAYILSLKKAMEICEKKENKHFISVIVSAIVFETLVLTCPIIEKDIPDSSNSLDQR